MSEIVFCDPRKPLVDDAAAELFPRDMTATFGAAVTLSQAQEKLAQVNQWLPIDGDIDQELGTLVETNSTGPLRLGYGAWRDLLLGVQFRNGKGELVSAGGRTVKNVAGYDLSKFMVGQRGIFGRVITLTTRTYVRPAAGLHARFRAGKEILARLIPSAIRPQWVILRPEELVCGYLGDERTIDFVARSLASWPTLSVSARISPADDAGVRGSHWLGGQGEPGIRAAVPPTNIEAFVRDAGLRDWRADPVFGIVQSWEAADASQVQHAARAAGGSALILREGKVLPDAQVNPWVELVLRRLKQAFDPENTLSPLP